MVNTQELVCGCSYIDKIRLALSAFAVEELVHRFVLRRLLEMRADDLNKAFRRCGDPRFVVLTLCEVCFPDSFTPGSTPAKEMSATRLAKRQTSPISAMSCAPVMSPTPYMELTISYSGREADELGS